MRTFYPTSPSRRFQRAIREVERIPDRVHDAFFSNGPTLIWEYPRMTPDGDQVEIVEVMEIAHRLISRHRIYWGWKGSLLIAPRLIKH